MTLEKYVLEFTEFEMNRATMAIQAVEQHLKRNDPIEAMYAMYHVFDHLLVADIMMKKLNAK